MTIGSHAPVIANNVAQGGLTGGSNAATIYLARWASPLTSDSQEVSGIVVAPSPAYLVLGGGGLLRCNSAGDHVEALFTDTGAYILTRTGSGTATARTSQTGLSIPSGTAWRFTAVGNVYSIYLGGSGTPTVTWTDTGGAISIGPGSRYVGIVLGTQENISGVAQGYGYNIDNWVGRDI
ncbi:hypothetical protein [Nocardia cyriacigeorgica]|uniref:hypothetical protein n=1 Tax=Nocardia cyriacigeorgica TaxID=135487 RepID=UPI0024584781|nr:hypothetical protein [Nocardia cyriacigeorgica]